MPTYLRKDVERVAPEKLANAIYDKTLRYVMIPELIDAHAVNVAIEPNKAFEKPAQRTFVGRFFPDHTRGLGDFVEDVINRLGLGWLKHKGCGCDRRKAWLNKIRFTK